MAVEILQVGIDELAQSLQHEKCRNQRNTLNTCDCRARGTTVKCSEEGREPEDRAVMKMKGIEFKVEEVL